MSSLFSFRLARARKEQSGVGVGKRKGADLRGAHVPGAAPEQPTWEIFFFLWPLRAVGLNAFTAGDDAIRRRHRLTGDNIYKPQSARPTGPSPEERGQTRVLCSALYYLMRA
jgi:hypothetical protein